MHLPGADRPFNSFKVYRNAFSYTFYDQNVYLHHIPGFKPWDMVRIWCNPGTMMMRGWQVD